MTIPATILLALLVTVSVQAEVPEGATLFVAEMEGELHTFLVAELIKKKVPLQVIAQDEGADYVLTGGATANDDKWFNSVFSGKDKFEGSVILVDARTRAIVWAGEAGDRTLLFGGWRRGGKRKIAGRIAKRMRKELFGK